MVLDYNDIRQLGIGTVDVLKGWQEQLRFAQPAAGSAFTRTLPGETWERLIAVTFQLTTGVATGQRQPVLNFADGDGNIFAQLPAGTNPGPNSTLTSFLANFSPTVASPPPSQQQTGTQAAPIAGTTITSVTLTQGTYTVSWAVMVTGTVAAAEINNFEILLGATVLLTSINGNTVGAEYVQEPVTFDVPAAGATLTVKNIGAATAASSYTASLDVVSLAGATYSAGLPDIVMPSGWQWQIAVTGIQAADQLSNIRAIIQRFPSDIASGDTYHATVAAWRNAMIQRASMQAAGQ